MVAGEFVFGEAREGGVVGVFEEPLPGCYVVGDCATCVRADGRERDERDLRMMSFWRLLKGILMVGCYTDRYPEEQKQ